MGNRQGKTASSDLKIADEAREAAGYDRRGSRVRVDTYTTNNLRGFGKFLIELTESITVSNAKKIATVLEFPPAQIEQIGGDSNDGHTFKELLQEKGIISSTDISQLTDALRKIGLHGIADEVRESFARNVSGITLDLQRKKEQFLKDIMETYEDLYSSVQPIPYIRDRMSCVNQVFTDSGIEYFSNAVGSTETGGAWIKLGSYSSVFTDPRLAQTMVFILYGEPGYGKSTLALQYVYDWCNRGPNSPLNEVEMLVFLRLRYLKEGVSFFKAIKQFLLPVDTKLSERDIEDIITSFTSLIILFDGFDEYSDSDNLKSDVIKIITRQMFRGFKVILTSRSSGTLPTHTHRTERLRLTGFDDQVRERYILKAVVNGDSEAAAKILQQLQQNPVLSDICQVPLFCVMFAHMTQEKDTSMIFDSVTSFFRYVVSCFYEHAQIRAGTATATDTSVTEHTKLDKVAFASLQRTDQKLVWGRDKFLGLIGETLYNELIEVGILVEEKVLRIVDDPGTSATDDIQRGTDVSFYHKLFCEWFAAHYFAQHVTGPEASNLDGFYEHIDAFDLQYVYRFACGLNPDAADKIVQYLHSIEGGDKFAVLCILEQTGQTDRIKDTIRDMCFEGFVISGYDSLLLQRSSMQLLEIAARNKIPINCVLLDNCLQSVDLSTAAIRTTSGLALTSRIPVKWLTVNLSNREMTEDEAIDILQFSSMCPSLRYLGYFGCVPPRVFKNKQTLLSLKSNGVTVWWYWTKDEPNYILNLDTGRWENENDGSEPAAEDFERMLSHDVKEREGWTEETYKGWAGGTSLYETAATTDISDVLPTHWPMSPTFYRTSTAKGQIAEKKRKVDQQDGENGDD